MFNLSPKKRNYDSKYREILITIITVTIVPIIVINAVFHFYNISRFEKSYMDVKVSQLKQSGTSAKEVVKHVDILMNILGQNEEIINFIVNPDESDFNTLARIHNALNDFIISGQNIHSIYIYSKTSGLIISSDSGLHRIQDFFDTDWIDNFDTHFLGRENLETRKVMIDGKPFHFVSFMRNLPLGTWSKIGGIVVNINESKFHEDIFHSGNDTSRGFIINTEGNIISHYNKSQLGQLYWNDLNAAQDRNIILFNRNRTIPLYVKDDYSKWGLVFEVDVSEIVRSVRNYLIFTLLVFLIVIVIIIVMDIKLSRQFYLPVKLLGDVKEDFEYAKPLIEGKILNNIIQNRYSSEQNILKDLEIIDLDISKSPNVIILIAIDRYRELIDKEEYESLAMLKLSLRQSLFSILDDSASTYLYSEVERDQICLLINLTDKALIEQQENLLKLAEEIRSHVAEEFPFTVTIGIGDVYKKMKNLHLSYQEAKNAVEYKLVHGQSRVIQYTDIKRSENSGIRFKSPYEKQIFQSIQLGLAEEIAEQVKNLCRDIRKSENYDIAFLKYIFERITHNLLEKFFPESGTGTDGNDTGLIEEFHRLETIEDIERWMTAICQKLAEENSGSRSTENQAAARKIGDYIDRNIANKNISLVDIGDALGLTPSYISRVFKESYGYNYLEYLNRSRIEKAKEYLKSEELSINEVGESVGFASTQSFLRVFQRYEKTSPGRYRKSLNERDSSEQQ
ncbi:MAG: helix-turn-helix domain-containing protein [Spirochaetales bacterium]|nr:helix-turn-helix domain-containing protein [Spirochaetales bacterium]